MLKPPELDDEQKKYVLAFNLMGGEIQWQSLEAIAEYLEIKDIDLLIDSLILFKTYQDSQSEK